MSDLLNITMIGFLSGITGTGIGGLMAFFIRGINKRIISFILEFSAGLMTAVVCFELLPEAFTLGNKNLVFVGLFLGIGAIICIENCIYKARFIRKSKGNNSLLATGILMSIGIALHNLPEGFAVGSGFEASVKLGLTLTIVIMIHDVPEGIAMAVPMRMGGLSPQRAFQLTILSGAPMGLGAFIGALLGEISRDFISICLGFAAGAMLYVVYAELVPQSKRMYGGRFSSMGNVLGILCGIMVTLYG